MLSKIQVKDKTFTRNHIKTHFVTPGEDYIELVKKYVVPQYTGNEYLFISEKIISICQNIIIRKEDMKLSFWAKTLSKFVHVTPAGEAVGNPYKMQYAINTAGLPKILFAAICAGIGKVFHKKGIFYEIAGRDVAGIDGFTTEAWDEYANIGIPLPKDPVGVCNKIFQETGVKSVLVDANYLGVEILGKSDNVIIDDETLIQMIIDNPAGQKRECTPFILISESNE